MEVVEYSNDFNYSIGVDNFIIFDFNGNIFIIE